MSTSHDSRQALALHCPSTPTSDLNSQSPFQTNHSHDIPLHRAGPTYIAQVGEQLEIYHDNKRHKKIRPHARLDHWIVNDKTGEGHWFLSDMACPGGVYVNGQRIFEPSSVHHGDELMIAGTLLRVIDHQIVAATQARATRTLAADIETADLTCAPDSVLDFDMPPVTQFSYDNDDHVLSEATNPSPPHPHPHPRKPSGPVDDQLTGDLGAAASATNTTTAAASASTSTWRVPPRSTASRRAPLSTSQHLAALRNSTAVSSVVAWWQRHKPDAPHWATLIIVICVLLLIVFTRGNGHQSNAPTEQMMATLIDEIKTTQRVAADPDSAARLAHVARVTDAQATVELHALEQLDRMLHEIRQIQNDMDLVRRDTHVIRQQTPQQIEAAQRTLETLATLESRDQQWRNLMVQIRNDINPPTLSPHTSTSTSSPASHTHTATTPTTPSTPAFATALKTKPVPARTPSSPATTTSATTSATAPVPASVSVSTQPPHPTPQVTAKPTPAQVPAPSHAPTNTTSTQHRVYVLDTSGSMIDTLPMATDFVIDNVAALNAKTQFAVVMYQDGNSFEMDPIGLSTNTADRLMQLRRHLDPMAGKIYPRGRSDMGDALTRAFKYAPNEIYLISDHRDEQYADRLSAQLEQLNADRQTRVHIVQFFANSDAAALQAIARAHRGEYQWISSINAPPMVMTEMSQDLLAAVEQP